jgi:Protein of unknown function (DUF3224)
MNDHESGHAIGQSQAKPPTRARAEAKIIVQSSEAKPYDQTASSPLMELSLSETFTGDIDGESPARASQLLRGDHSACLVSMQRFHGKLGGRQGTFVFQGSEIVENGKVTRRHGLSFPDREQAIFPGCAVWKRLQNTGLLVRMIQLRSWTQEILRRADVNRPT